MISEKCHIQNNISQNKFPIADAANSIVHSSIFLITNVFSLAIECHSSSINMAQLHALPSRDQ